MWTPRSRRFRKSTLPFAAGDVLWTQVRLLCRVASPANEREWLVRARGMTAHALSREVRAVDQRSLEGGGLGTAGGLDRLEDEEPRETLRLRCSPATRAKWGAARQLAQRVAGETLPVWACAEAIAAEVMSAVAADPVGDEAAPEDVRGHGKTHASRMGRLPDAMPTRSVRPDPEEAAMLFLHALTDELAACDVFDLDARLRRAVRLEAEHLRELGPMLLEISRSRGHRALGYGRFDDFVREQLGMSASRARALLRIERLALCCNEFAAAWRGGQLSWTQADVLARLFADEASGPWRSAWIERAQTVTVRRLTDDLEAALAGGCFDPASLADPCDGSQSMQERQTGAPCTLGGGTAELFFTAPRAVARLFRAVLSSLQRRLGASEGQALDAMLEHVFVAWGRNRPVPKKYALFSRDGWRCSAPGCTSYRNLHGHHIVFRSQGGSDELTNLTTLCAFHHLRGVHGATLRVTGTAPSRLRFELGLRPGSKPLMVFGSGEVRLAVAG